MTTTYDVKITAVAPDVAWSERSLAEELAYSVAELGLTDVAVEVLPR